MALRVRNISAGYTDGTGFHPIRSASDYDPARAGEKKKKTAKKKAVTKKKATKKAAKRRPAKRRVVKRAVKRAVKKTAKKAVRRSGNPKLVKGTQLTAKQRDQVLRTFVNRYRAIGPGKAYKSDADWVNRHAFYITAAGNVSSRPGYAEPDYLANPSRKRNVPYTVTLPVARHMGSLYAQKGMTKQDAWSAFIKWARGRTLAMPLPAESIKRQRIKEAFLKEYDRTKALLSGQAAKNPARSATPKFHAGYGTSQSVVARSAYLGTLRAAQKMMPFPSRVDKLHEGYALVVAGKDAPLARQIVKRFKETRTKKS